MGEDNINLMPEDQRSKEQNLVAKQKKEWEHELVIPGQVEKTKKGKKSGSKVSIWAKLFKSKKPKKVKESKVDQDKKPIKTDKVFTPVDKVESVLPSHSDKVPKQKKKKHKKKKKDKNKHEPVKHEEIKFTPPAVPQDKVEANFSSPAPVKTEEPEPKFDLPKIEDHKFETHKQAKKKKKKKKKHKKDKQKPDEKKEVMPPASGPGKDDDGLNLADWHQPTSNIRARFVEEGVDLIPTAVKIKSWKQIRNLLIVSFVLSIVVVALFYVGLMWQERKIINEKQAAIQGISDLEEEILAFQAQNEKISALAKDIKTIHAILKQHIYWSNFFELLEKYTAQEVYYQGLTAGNNGALTLHAIGPNFDAVARQLKALQSVEARELAISVSVTSASLAEINADEPSVSFDINFVLNPTLFYYEDSQ